MEWILKAIVQKGISYLPASQKLNYLFQKHVTKGVQLSSQYFGDKLSHAIDHIQFFKQHRRVEAFKCLELGSGWYPVVPIALFLAGADEVHSIDISPLMKREGIQQTIKEFVVRYQKKHIGRFEATYPFRTDGEAQSIGGRKTEY